MLPNDGQHGWPNLRLFYTKTLIDLWTCCAPTEGGLAAKKENLSYQCPLWMQWRRTMNKVKFPEEKAKGWGRWEKDESEALTSSTKNLRCCKKKNWVIKINNILMQMIWKIKISAKRSLMNKISKFLMTGSVNSAVGSNIGAWSKRKIQ